MTLITPVFDYSSVPPATAAKLRQAVIGIHAAHTTALAAVAEIGEHLNTVKDLLPHGRFNAWLAAEFGLTARTAENYMSAARFLDGKPKGISDLPAHIVYKLAAQSAPPEVVNDVLAAADAGTPLAAKEIEGRLERRARDAVKTSGGRDPIEQLEHGQEWEQAKRRLRLKPLAGEVIAALGDDLLRRMLKAFSGQDATTFIDLLRASDGGAEAIALTRQRRLH